MTPDDLRRTASACRRVLEPVADADWDARAGELEWSCRETLVHMLTALTYYAVNLATRSTEPRSSGHADPALPLEELLDALEGRAAVLAELCATAPPGVRGAHGWGLADASGFAALACNELLIHTSDVAGPLGASFDPPRETCAGVLARLFPWAPGGRDAWETLRWATGRVTLGDRPRVGPDWVAHPAPLDEWDGVDPNVAAELVDLRLDDQETDEAEAGG